MPSWRDEYLCALQQRDKKEKANQAFYEQYSRLADRTARLQSALVAGAVNKEPTSSPKPEDRKAGPQPALPRNPTQNALAKVRQDLGEAQRSRGFMETKLQSVSEELNKLKMKSSFDNRRIKELTKEKAILATGLRDRDEELRGKTKLLEDVHDETVSLTLQLNMSEEQSSRLMCENKELVDRWMARMGQEADAMNDTSKFS